MSRKFVSLGAVIVAVLAMAGTGAAQLAPPPPDPLAGMRAAAAGNAQVCTNSETSACAQANPKILAAALGSSVLAENLRALTDVGPRLSGTPGMDRAIAWAMTAFRDVGADTVITESGYADPPAGSAERSVIAEIRGREKPDEFVVMAANFADNCSAALLVEAARDIHLTGLRPRRSVRFVLFGSQSLGAWAFVRKHRSELQHVIAAASFETGCTKITGFNLNGRQDMEPGIAEALNFAPIQSWGIANNIFEAAGSGNVLDFLLEGVPSVTAIPQRTPGASRIIEPDLDTLKRNAAIAGVLAFGLAEHATPVGPRLSRAEIDTLLKRIGIDSEMRKTNLWELWESGKRGRLP